jgi:hypothetical protein
MDTLNHTPSNLHSASFHFELRSEFDTEETLLVFLSGGAILIFCVETNEKCLELPEMARKVTRQIFNPTDMCSEKIGGRAEVQA